MRDPGETSTVSTPTIAGLQATLTVLAVLEDDISDCRRGGPTISSGDADGLEAPDGL